MPNQTQQSMSLQADTFYTSQCYMQIGVNQMIVQNNAWHREQYGSPELLQEATDARGMAAAILSAGQEMHTCLLVMYRTHLKETYTPHPLVSHQPHAEHTMNMVLAFYNKPMQQFVQLQPSLHLPGGTQALTHREHVQTSVPKLRPTMVMQPLPDCWELGSHGSMCMTVTDGDIVETGQARLAPWRESVVGACVGLHKADGELLQQLIAHLQTKQLLALLLLAAAPHSALAPRTLHMQHG